MCGIAGLYSSQNTVPDKNLLNRMAQAIHHRGPDESGTHLAPHVALAIQRLKIIDLVTGQQPVFNETKDVVTVFNGEIYNYKKLRDDLQKKGHTFTTQSDTETIVHLYEEHGEDFVHYLNGMFAIALWDDKNKKLILARDPAGIKPLFYSLFNNKLTFGSEIKAVLENSEIPKTIDSSAFIDYLSFYYVSAPRTIYKHIHRLPAGTFLTVQNGNIQLKKYWDLKFDATQKTSLDEMKKEFLSVLDQSVQRHLQSDVPVGIFLSGGLDSASLVAVASRHSRPLRTFSIGYQESSYSELKEAHSVAKLYGTQHHEYVMTSHEMTDLLPKVIRQMDEPHGDWSSTPNYLLSQLAKKDVTVILNGAGGDEIFGGYPTLLAAQASEIYKKFPGWFRNEIIERLVRHLPTSHKRMSFDFLAKSFLRGADFPLEEAHRRFKEIFNKAERDELLTNEAYSTFKDSNPAHVFEDLRESFEKFEPLNRLMYLDFKVFMAHSPLHVCDITSSAHAVEARVPYLDKEMIEFSSRVPSNLKIKGLTTKYIVREALKGTLPPAIIKMKKKGFLIPGAPWIKKDLKPFILDIIGVAKKDHSWLFNFKYIDRLLEDHFSGRFDNTRKITCLVSFFIWHKMASPSWETQITNN